MNRASCGSTRARSQRDGNADHFDRRLAGNAHQADNQRVGKFTSFALVLACFVFAGHAAAIVMDESEDERFGTPLDRLVVSGHVGTVAGGGLTIVYLGEGWVLTASHVGAHDVEIEGRVYPKAPDATIQIFNEDRSEADLIAFRILGNPELPDLPPLEISEKTPTRGAFAVLAGAGRKESSESRTLADSLRRIWRGRRDTGPSWGTNTIAGASERVAIGDWVTDAIVTDFSLVDDIFATPYEAQAVKGDSGGALFIANGEQFVLAGVLFAASESDPYQSKPSLTFAVDLARYREQILAAIEAENPGRHPVQEVSDTRRPEFANDERTVAAIAGTVALGIAVSLAIRRVRNRRVAE
jgi:hypothetical protein